MANGQGGYRMNSGRKRALFFGDATLKDKYIIYLWTVYLSKGEIN